MRRTRGGPRASAGRLAALALRAYSGMGGPVLAVVLFLTTEHVWGALASLVPWFILAGMMRRLSRS